MTDPDFDPNRVLTRAADDGDRPYDYSIDTVLRRGRRRVRVRTTTGAAASAVAVGAIAVGATQLTGSGRTNSDNAPVAGSSTRSASTAVSATNAQKRIVPAPPVATMPDRTIIQRCKVLDEEFRRVSSNKAGGGTDPFDDWSVVIKEAPQRWVHAILVSPDGKRYAHCTLDATGKRYREESVRQSIAVAGRDYRVSAGLGAAAEPVPADVARITFETSTATYEARVKDGFVLWFRPFDWTDKPLWANFYDASGKRIARFDTNPHLPAPSTHS